MKILEIKLVYISIIYPPWEYVKNNIYLNLETLTLWFKKDRNENVSDSHYFLLFIDRRLQSKICYNRNTAIVWGPHLTVFKTFLISLLKDYTTNQMMETLWGIGYQVQVSHIQGKSLPFILVF